MGFKKLDLFRLKLDFDSNKQDVQRVYPQNRLDIERQAITEKPVFELSAFKLVSCVYHAQNSNCHSQKANRPETPDPKDVICPHLHFKYDIIDRGILSREQHLNLLSTPKGYRWVVKDPHQQGAQKIEEEVFTCADRRKKPGRDYVHNFLAEIWNMLTPEMIQRLKEMLMNEFGMSPDEAVKFICEQRVKTLEMAHRPRPCIPEDDDEEEEEAEQLDPRQPRVIIEPKPCDRSQFAIGVEPCHIKEFSKIVSNKLADYVVGMMCARRNNRHRRMAEVILNSLCLVTGEKCTLEKQKSRLHKILAVTADRTALWLSQNVEDEDKKRDSKRRKEDVELQKKQKERDKEIERRRKEKEKLNKQSEKDKRKKAKKEEKEAKIAKEKEEQKKAEREKKRKDLQEAAEKREKKQKEEEKKGEGDGKKKGGPGSGGKGGEGGGKGGGEGKGAGGKGGGGGGGKGGGGGGGKSGGGGKGGGGGGKGGGGKEGGAKGDSSRPASAGKKQDQQSKKSSAGGSQKVSEAKKGGSGGGQRGGQKAAGGEDRKRATGEEEEGEGDQPGETEQQDEARAQAGGGQADQDVADKPPSETATAKGTEDTPGGTTDETKAEAEAAGAPGEAGIPGEAGTPGGAGTSGEAGAPGEERATGQEGAPREEGKTPEEIAKAREDAKARGEVTEEGSQEKVGKEAPQAEAAKEASRAEAAKVASKEASKTAGEQVRGEGDQSEAEKMIAKTVSQIIDTKKRPSPRQEALQDVVSKELEKRVAGDEVPVDDETKQMIREYSGKVATWMDQKVATVEQEYGTREKVGQQPVAQRPKGPIYVLKKSGPDGAIDVRVSTHSEVEQKIRSVKKGGSAKTAPAPSPDTPMTPEDTKMWAKWAEDASEMAEEWGKWIDKTIQDAEDKAVKFRNKAKDAGIPGDSDVADWEKFADKTQIEALKWRRNRKVFQQQARVWKQKTSIH